MTTTGRKHRVLMISIAVAAGAAALLSVALAYQEPVLDPTLGADWQCRRTMFMTSCTRAEQAIPTAHNSQPRACPPRV
jgi:hypothetical protein